MTLRRNDLRGVLAFVSDAHDVDAPEALTPGLLDRLAGLMGCEYATYEDIDWSRRVVVSYVPCSNEGPPVVLPYLPESFWDEKTAAYPLDATLDKHSDRLDRRERERIRDEGECNADFGLVDRLSLFIGDRRRRIARLGFDSQGRDFDDRDRELALALRPHLDVLWRRAISRRHIAELLAALERDAAAAAQRAIVLFAPDGRIDHATREAQRLLREWFGTRNGHLPSELDEWAAQTYPGARITTRRDSATLTVELAGEFTLTLHEHVQADARLTPREREVLTLVAEGLTNALIARRLWVSPSTVAKHLEQAYRKLRVQSRTAAIARVAQRARPPA